jgi:glycosyltransferase involved in cell wall biosynthesis
MAKLAGVNFGHELIPNLLLVPDFASGWIPLSVLKGLKLISTQRIDLIFATCKPNSSAIIGAILSKLSGKPLVIDLRDPWRRGIVQKMVGNRSRANTNVAERWKGLVDEILETKSLQQASKIILTTQETLQVYCKLYPSLKNRFEVIYNGYADDFFTEESKGRFNEFTIVYSGSYYYYLDKSEAFFQALANIKKDNKLNGNIRFIYIGKSAIVSKMIKKYNLRQMADCTGYLGRKEAIDLVRSASVILLRNIKPHLSTKLFEGLASGIPLLALTGEGEAGDLVRQYSRSSMIVGDSNPIEIEDAIRSMYTKWAERKLVYEVSSAFKARFSKYSLTEQFAEILNRCAN